VTRPVIAAALFVVMTPLVAAAQTLSDTTQPMTQGPMTVVRAQSGFVAGPDFKITDVDGSAASLVGGYAGWVEKESIFIGGGGYWMANNTNNRKMAYGGFIMQWMGFGSGPVGVGAKLLLGGGEGTLSSVIYGSASGPYPNPNASTPSNTTSLVRYSTGFWVTEPEVNLFVKLGKNARITAGGSYRFVGTGYYGPYYYGPVYYNSDGARLSGFSGSIGLQLGGGF
jgi:hypothetical protein